MNFETFLIHFQKAKEAEENFVVVTLVGHVGSVPQESGARLIVTDKGYYAGTVGGGKLEKAAIESAQRYLKKNLNQSYFQEFNLQKDLGMSCGGEAKLFFEVHLTKKKWSIILFGAGHVIQELSRVLLRLECQITCVDSRSEWLEKLPNDSKLKKVHLDEMAEFATQLTNEDFVVTATMGHLSDLPILQAIEKAQVKLPYLGVIGSDLKAKRLKQNLIELGVSKEFVDSLQCPIGLEIGNNTPAEIAISITAQLLHIRDKFIKKDVFP